MTGQRVSDVSENFEKQIRALREANALASGPDDQQQGNWEKAQWMQPQGWGGDLFDLEAMSEPFDRSQANQWFLDAITQPEKPGVTGDSVISATQIDYLACLERSFRIRHTMRRPRAFVHALGRQAGLGHETGTFTQDLEYVRSLVKESSLEPA